MSYPQNIAIIGGGPSGSTLAALLAREDKNVGVFQPERDEGIMVGESLVPGIVPILRELGVEDEVRSIGRFKPGAAFNIKENSSPVFSFDRIPGELPSYAYNVRRKAFDRTLLDNAIREGATRFPYRAEVSSADDGERIRLSRDLPDQVFSTFHGQPDLIVDATGRTRLLPRMLDLPSETVGDTQGSALFTHLDDMAEADRGNVHTEVFDRGWAWRIPLENRVSIGIVTEESYMDEVGDTNEERLQYFLQNIPRLQSLSRNSERMEPVYRFDNYQLISNELYGKNWVLLGDTAGFIDPVFSTGLFLAMDSARTLSEGLLSDRPPQTVLRTYEQTVLDRLETWQEVIRYYYNGRLLAVIDLGQEMKRTTIGKLLNTHVRKHLGRIFTGAASDSWYSIALLKFMCNYGLRNRDPEEFKVF